jgi:UDP-N-acetylmuramate--alanine ligase
MMNYNMTGNEQMSLADLLKVKNRVHFLGIGGVGMSALARILVHRGYTVSGCDSKESAITSRLRAAGCSISIGTTCAIPVIDVAIYSSAIREDHPQFEELKMRGIPIFHRSMLLGYFMNNKISIGVTGTHGKTTTSALISFVLSEMGLNPTCFVGGELLNYGDNAILGGEDIIVAEVDESDKSLLNIFPRFSVLTNLEEDHMDTYKDMDDLKSTMINFIEHSPDESVVIYNNDSKQLQDVVRGLKKKAISYGIEAKSCFNAFNIICNGFCTMFDLHRDGCFVGKVMLPLSGYHNVYNTLAAFAVFAELDLDMTAVIRLLPSFKGTGRRMQITYRDENLLVLDDYAHHPTEVRATLAGVQQFRSADERLVVVFQPHRFSRTLYFSTHFGTCFKGADLVVITDIYGAGEKAIDGVDGTIVYTAVKNSGIPTAFVKKKDIIPFLLEQKKGKTIITFLGAGDITEIAYEFATVIKNNASRA